MRKFFRELNRRLLGHYNYFGVHGNRPSLVHLFRWALACAFKWLNLRGGKRRIYTLKTFDQVLDQVGIARPPIPEVRRRRVFA